jgi:hypothetical protein
MNALRPWHLVVLLITGLLCAGGTVAVVAALLALVKRGNR